VDSVVDALTPASLRSIASALETPKLEERRTLGATEAPDCAGGPPCFNLSSCCFQNDSAVANPLVRLCDGISTASDGS
jgi:hypothetical protein